MLRVAALAAPAFAFVAGTLPAARGGSRRVASMRDAATAMPLAEPGPVKLAPQPEAGTIT